jgi:hypothetical protein
MVPVAAEIAAAGAFAVLAAVILAVAVGDRWTRPATA